MKRKCISMIFGALLCMSMAFGLAACDFEITFVCDKHAYSEWTETKAATCTAAGEKTRKCEKCSYVEKETIEAKGHNPGDEWTKDENGHWHVCVNAGCGAKCDAASHTDSDKDDKCDECGYEASAETPHTHTYGDVTYTWNEENTVCTATRTCTDCTAETDGHTQTANATIGSMVKQNATCSLPELTTYTATFTEDWAETQTKANVQTATATGHNPGDEWTKDENGHWHICNNAGCGAKCDEASHKDENNDHKCDVCEYITSEHTYGDVTYAWNEENTICTATRTCTNCTAETDGHTQTANATIGSMVKQNATCSLPELTTYTATFTEDWAETQTKANVQTATATGHNPSDEWTKDENGHWHICNNAGCGSKCDEASHKDENNDHKCDVCEYVSEHAYGTVTYTWNEENSACVATKTCSLCGEDVEGHTLTADGTISGKVTQTRTCSVPELTTYTATFTEDWAETQTKENVETAAKYPHTASTAWKYNATYHWHECTISNDCKEILGSAKHTYDENGACVCGMVKGDGFQFFYDATADGYTITKYIGSNSVVTIPSFYDDGTNGAKSVLSVGKSAFEGSSITKVIFGEGILTIGESAFYGCASLEKVELPSTLTSVGDRAFYKCTGVKNIEFPDKVTSFGSEVFAYCSALTSVQLAKNMTSVSVRMFRSCTALESVTIPDAVTSIDSYAFAFCDKLASVQLSANLKRIENNAFYNCGVLGSIAIPEKMTSIGEKAFSGCESLTSVVVPSGVTSIGTGAFNGCKNIEKISYPAVISLSKLLGLGNSASSSKLTAIVITGGDALPANAFDGGNYLTSITLPATIQSIGTTSFLDCKALQAVYYQGTIETWLQIDFVDSRDNEAFNKALLMWNGETYEQVTSIEIPETITEIYAWHFYNMETLVSMTIPASVKKIGERAFYGAANLKTVYYKGTVENWCGIELGDDFSTPLYYKPTLSLWAGEAYTTITELVIPETVTAIGKYQFTNWNSLVSVSIPSSVKSIGRYAFWGCDNLKSAEIVADGTSIGDSIFRNCSKLESVTITGTVTSMGIEMFYYNRNLTSVTLPKGITTIDADFFREVTRWKLTITFCGTQEEWNAIDVQDSKLTQATMKYLGQ